MPGRPRSFDREQALETALICFWSGGFERTSVAGLTEAIGINPPSLYAAFGDKARLFSEAADRYVAGFRAGVDDCLSRTTAREAISALLDEAAEHHSDRRTPAGCLVLSEARLEPERERLRERIAGRIRAGQADGDLGADLDADAVASFLEAVMVGMSARARHGAGRDELVAIAHTALGAIPARGHISSTG